MDLVGIVHFVCLRDLNKTLNAWLLIDSFNKFYEHHNNSMKYLLD